MYSVFLMTILAAAAPALPSLAHHDKLQLRPTAPKAATVACYSRFELNPDFKATFDNPFDPHDVELDAVFTSPDGTVYRVNGFYTQDCSRKLVNGGEQIHTVGKPYWQIRFTPNRPGKWRYKIHARDRSGSVTLPEAEFTVTPSDNPGFIRRNAHSPRYFAFDNQKPFFAIGEDMCWPGRRGTYDYDEWLPALAKGGGNWIRFWTYRWNCCLEWGKAGKAKWETVPFRGLGFYNLQNAWKLDTILTTAEKNGVYVMLCLGTYGEFINGGYFHEGLWNSNPYNAANGGPCVKPADFWTNSKARKLYRQRLRYIAARYGSYTNLFGWEFWNEAHPTPKWVTEMSQFLKGKGAFKGHPADPYRHLISTTYGTPAIWKIPEVDFTQSHHYGEGNIPDEAPVIHEDAIKNAVFGKPHLMAEFGIDWRSSDDKYDPHFHGINLHNGLWSSALSGDAGGAMIWYWDTYVQPGKLYSQFTPLRAFTDRIPWNDGPWRLLKTDPPQVPVASGKQTWRDLTLTPTEHWGKSAVNEFTVAPRENADNQPVPKFLFGSAKSDMSIPLVFHVDYGAPGRFEVKVDGVSSSVRLRITLDGKKALSKTLSAVPPEKGGPPRAYVSTEFKPKYKIYQARFDTSYGIPVPAGKHTIHVEVPAGDWVSIAKYTFIGYVSDRYPPVRIYGLTNGAQAYLWAQNTEHNWLNDKNGVVAPVIHGAQTTLHGLPAGAYTVRWWDTWKGGSLGQQTVQDTDRTLVLTLPDLATDVAASVEARP